MQLTDILPCKAPDLDEMLEDCVFCHAEFQTGWQFCEKKKKENQNQRTKKAQNNHTDSNPLFPP